MRAATTTVRLIHEPSGVVYDFAVHRVEVVVTRRVSTTHRRTDSNTVQFTKPRARAFWAWLLNHGYRRDPPA